MDAGTSGSEMTEQRRPLGAFVISAFGGFLIVAEGLVVIFLANLISALGASSAGTTFAWTGALVVLLGLVVFFLAVGVLTSPEYHRGLGIALIVFSLLSFLVGGGFFLGAVLGVIGGMGAYLWKETLPFPRPGTPARRSDFPHTDRTCASCGKLISGSAAECPFCHTPTPASLVYRGEAPSAAD
jgi:hypothetical protein